MNRTVTRDDAYRWAAATTTGTVTDKLVLMLMVVHADARLHANPERETLAAQAGVTPRTVRRSLTALRQAGLILALGRPGRGSSTLYRLEVGAGVAGGK